jgi:hypothetical protein
MTLGRYFNITADNWQMENLWKDTSTAVAQSQLRAKLFKWFHCSGDTCM